MRARLIVLTALAVCALAGTAAAQEREAYTTREMEGLKGGAPNRVAREDLLSVLRPVKEIRRGMFVMLHGVDFETRPYATGYAGLCRKDMMWLSYAPLADAPPGRDAPLAPQGINAASSFAPLGKLRRLAGAKSIPFTDGGPCAQHDDEGWIGASDPESVVLAVRLLDPLEARLRAGTLMPAPCPSLFDAKKGCAKTILETLATDGLNQVKPCDNAPAGGRCMALDYGWDTTIEVRFTAGTDRITPGAITAVRIEQYIVVT